MDEMGCMGLDGWDGMVCINVIEWDGWIEWDD